MIGIVIVTHSRLADELRRAAEMILGPLEALETVNIEGNTSVETAQRDVAAAIAAVGDDGDGVVILTDLFGGTPTNISAEFLQEGQVELLTGVNLPMLLKCAGIRLSLNLDELVSQLQDYTRNSIVRPLDLLR